MSIELSKADKKIAREIIDKGLQKEFSIGLSTVDNILNDWKNKVKNNSDSYHLLYKHIEEFDKQIAWRYDRMTGSNYLFIIVAQLREGLITDSDLERFSEETRQRIKLIFNL